MQYLCTGVTFQLHTTVSLFFLLPIALARQGGNPITFDNSTNSKMVSVLSASLGVALVTNFILFPATKFKANKVHGFILVVLYIVLLTTSIVIEFSG